MIVDPTTKLLYDDLQRKTKPPAPELSVREWLDVRERVAQKLKDAGSSQQGPARIQIAEQLLVAGYVNIDMILYEFAVDNTEPAYVPEEDDQ